MARIPNELILLEKVIKTKRNFARVLMIKKGAVELEACSVSVFMYIIICKGCPIIFGK